MRPDPGVLGTCHVGGGEGPGPCVPIVRPRGNRDEESGMQVKSLKRPPSPSPHSPAKAPGGRARPDAFDGETEAGSGKGPPSLSCPCGGLKPRCRVSPGWPCDHSPMVRTRRTVRPAGGAGPGPWAGGAAPDLSRPGTPSLAHEGPRGLRQSARQEAVSVS